MMIMIKIGMIINNSNGDDDGLCGSLCKGQTLFTQLHVRKEKFPMNRIVIIASQIAQVSPSLIFFVIIYYS